jgi:phenylacetic acid degradation operon negative regulatory protein
VTNEATAVRPRLPRPQVGAQPQHLLISLLGDYWSGRCEPLPSVALVALAEEFGISSSSARAALSRLTHRELLRLTKSGRNTFYSATPLAERMLAEGRHRVLAFGRGFPAPWDGTWLVVIFSVPEEQREARYQLLAKLRWLGFGPLDDGVWVSPRHGVDDVAAAFRECGIEQVTLLRALPVELGGVTLRHPLSAWNLDEMAQAYEQFTGTFDPLLQRVLKGQVSVSEALAERSSLTGSWRTLAGLYPDLPDELLPAHWPRGRAHEIFTETYDTLGPLARTRFCQVITPYAPAIAHLAGYQTTRTALGAEEPGPGQAAAEAV